MLHITPALPHFYMRLHNSDQHYSKFGDYLFMYLQKWPTQNLKLDAAIKEGRYTKPFKDDRQRI